MAEAVTSGWRTHTSSCRRVSPGRVRHTVLAFSTGSDGSFRPRISLEQELGGKGKPVSSEQATCQLLASPSGRGKSLGGGDTGGGEMVLNPHCAHCLWRRLENPWAQR